jgi:AcrR family transcriptional regulator
MSASDDPRQRLLDAAGEVFADKGLKGGTVREICARAGVNIAAINYYFRDKEQLYLEAVKQAACAGPGAIHPAWPAGTGPAVKLYDFIHVIVNRMLDNTRPAWHVRLLMREMAQPTSACEQVVRDYIKPLSAILQSILGELLPADTPRFRRFMTGFSIVGQCLYYCQNRVIARLLMGEEDYQRLDAATIADHITRFTLAALGLAPPLQTAAGEVGQPVVVQGQ